MESVNPQAFEYVISKVTDGFLFERFAQDLLCQILGVEFVPAGKIRDRAIDGLEHCAQMRTDQKTIYQISIEVDPKSKIDKTILALQKNGVKCERLFYVTNKVVENQDILEEDFYNNYGIVVRCRDAAWLRGNINKNEGTVRTYLTFIESHYHEFIEPGKSQIVADFAGDPRIFVFLRQQWEEYGHEVRLDDLLTDSLIIFSLEGTDPDKSIFMSRQEIFDRIEGLVAFSPKNMEARIDHRLGVLSTKPRRINHHRDIDKYCLPYSTRLELEEQNLADRALYEKFVEAAPQRLSQHLSTQDVKVKDALCLLESSFNTIFKHQGLEFADFIIKAENSDAVEKSLPDIISEVVDSSSVIPQNRYKVKAALLSTIREIIYKGSNEEREYIRRLAHSYMMLFLLQCDPKICAFFSAMASKLSVFVCTSILVPALSELPLQKEHRRHWNLLVSARSAGVDLLINKVILGELVGHIRKAIHLYDEDYRGREEIFSDEIAVRYVDAILLRSYFYSLANGQKWSFREFIDNFVTPSAAPDVMEREMIELLRHQFGIRYVEEKALGVAMDQTDLVKLASELEKHKMSKHQASNDAQTILSIYSLREKNNETGDSGVFGYRTWWLSKDTTTQRAVTKCFGHRYPTSCYIRPDFLLNYISLAPSREDADRAFDRMFPTLMGVTVSHHIPEDISNIVHAAIKQHSTKDGGRVRAILRTLSDKLKTDQKTVNRVELKHYLDEQFSKD